jgi:hypothetical protein
MVAEQAQVLITVQAAPEPSKTYGDTVCVAGIRIDGDRREWVRIYPVPLRHLDDDNRFKKFQVIDVRLNATAKDPRVESRRPELTSIRTVGDRLSMAGRGPVLEAMVGPTMCDLEQGAAAAPTAQSLGLVRPSQVHDVVFEKHGGWTPEQQQAMAQEPDLFATGELDPVLEAPRFKVKYVFACGDLNCPGHTRRILDWELVALERKYRNRSDVEVKKAIKTKFLDQMCGPDRRPHFFVGNYADPVKRRFFSVLGVYSPKATTDYGSALF